MSLISLRRSYTLIAPLYDAVLAGAGMRLRAASLDQLPREGSLRILISGIGTGLDFPYLPACHHYLGLDLTAAMLDRAKSRTGNLRVDLVQGNSMSLPFANESFDYVVLHLILAIVPDARACLDESSRVLKPGGKVMVLDKFLKRGEPAGLRRVLNKVSQHVVTRLDVIFEDVLDSVQGLRLEEDVPVLAGGWFRRIRLIRTG